MEQIKSLSEISALIKIPLPTESTLREEERDDLYLKVFHAGQCHLGEQVLYALEQIKISIDHNDGHFCQLLSELEENLTDFLK